ncbi:histidine phosphatase family protein [Lapidilactobacillus bayanensis]|uniref:histidine phosphatase family protein n=1 Tax=Lapidilactobacillus bayanensis TaxID=2485998 RepID=UPI0013DE70B6|nr:histidine phosphatase family protein [Lapidilactobacillus bayanensis]
MQIYLTRHGQTLLNRTNRAQGWSDALLTTKGRTDAIALGRGLNQQNLRFDAAYSSDLTRAVTTAKLVLHEIHQDELTLQTSADFREECFGYFEGETANVMSQELFKIDSYRAAVTTYHKTMRDLADGIATKFNAQTPEEGESYVVLQKRLMHGLQSVINAAKQSQYEKVLIVSHGNAITTILNTLGQQLTEPLHNASVSILVPEADGIKVAAMDDVGYIEQGKEQLF